MSNANRQSIGKRKFQDAATNNIPEEQGSGDMNVGGDKKEKPNGRERKNYGDISFWLEDRRRREQKSGSLDLRPCVDKQPGGGAYGKENSTDKVSHHNQTVCVHSQLKKQGVRRILSHVEITMPPKSGKPLGRTALSASSQAYSTSTSSTDGLRRSARNRNAVHPVNYAELELEDNDSESLDDQARLSPQESEFEEDAVIDDQGSEMQSLEPDEDAEAPKKKKRKTSKSHNSTSHKSSLDPEIKALITKKCAKRMVDLTKGPREISQTLAPISTIADIFTDITRRSAYRAGPNLVNVLEHIGNRPLRVATMCSGTESPLLALECIRDSLKDLGLPDLSLEHVFSAEIVPFKQAYIERNFDPPIIFRDIVEITDNKGGKATTAYGGQIEIPGGLDLVIAGTACVDFSSLNTKRKQLDEGGESGDTFAAVLEYAKAYRPSILVLENVYNAPWDAMLALYEKIGYAVVGAKVDTKQHYLPQTRQRGYMVCFNKDRLPAHVKPTQLSDTWTNVMEEMKRPASSPISDFLLPNDDAEVVRSRQNSAKQSALDFDKTIRDVDWIRCEIRHIFYRRAFNLGNSRPMTEWQDNGTVTVYENCDRIWYNSQCERVWDFMDLSLLRRANDKNGRYDARYKTRVWDVSQNIDRFYDTTPFGVSSCLTPSGIFYVTDRGGSLIFAESLVLQGIPLEKISFTTETERQIQDLAGNAMSSPVVGTAIVASLIAGYETLASNPEQASAAKNTKPPVRIDDTNRPQRPLPDESNPADPRVASFLQDAQKSARKCDCEGRIDVTGKPIQTCHDCNHTSCIACGVKPVHNYADPEHLLRGTPGAFIQKWRRRLPMQVEFGNKDHLQTFLASQPMKGNISKEGYIDAVFKATNYTLAFKEMRRMSHWVIAYESPHAKLELVLDGKQSEWRLLVKPGRELAGNDPLRIFFEQPIAKSRIDEDNFMGRYWDWRIPDPVVTSKLEITAQGSPVPSWAARLGLLEHHAEVVPSELRVDATNDANFSEAASVSGTYVHLPHCGTACDTLYKRSGSFGSPDLFFFLDPGRITNPENDSFVFSLSHSRLQYDQKRDIVASIDPEWRPESMDGKPLKGSTDGRWIQDEACSLNAALGRSAVSVYQEPFLHSNCLASKAIATCEFEVHEGVEQRLIGSHLIHPDDKMFFQTFGWALEPLRRDLGYNSKHILASESVEECNQCAPPIPEMRWHLDHKTELRAYEDPKKATEYEIAVKTRPQPFVLESSVHGKEGKLRIGINILSLCQRAAGRLRKLTSRFDSASWSLDTAFSNEGAGPLPALSLHNNVESDSFDTDILKIGLFPKQKKSLGWMINQEAGSGQEFVLEETEEAVLPHLGWRLEAQATSVEHIKGGILADHPGFGKTVTSLALIHSEFLEKGSTAKIVDSMATLKATDISQVMPRKIAATLVVCPENLVLQWKDEVAKFFGEEYNSPFTIAIRNMSDFSKCSIGDLEKARIIIVSRNLFENQNYRARLALFGGVPQCSAKGAREIRAWLKTAAKDVPKHLQILETDGLHALKMQLGAAYAEHLNDPSLRAMAAQSKRKKGQQYTESKLTDPAKQETKKELEQDQPDLDKHNDALRSCVLFEMFHFNRIVVDEFSYLESGDLNMMGAIKADKRWGLSATPHLRDPFDVSRMARLLGLRLPMSVSAPGFLSSTNSNLLKKDMTSVEQFEAYREMPSRVILQRVHSTAQRFLDCFVRQNIQESHIRPLHDCIVPVELNAEHRVNYTDVSQQMNSQEMRLRSSQTKTVKGKKVKDLENTAEALLVKEAALFKSHGGKVKGDSLKSILHARENSRVAAEKALRADIGNARRLAPGLDRPDNCTLLLWAGCMLDNILGDQSVSDRVGEMIGPIRLNKALVKKRKMRSREDVTRDTELKDRVCAAHQKARSLVNIEKSIRFIQRAIAFYEHHSKDAPLPTCEFEGCSVNYNCAEHLAVSAACGHIICSECHKASMQSHEKCGADGCGKDVKSYHLLHVNKMGNIEGSKHGTKADTVIELLQKIRKDGEQAILFVQYEDQMRQVQAILKEVDIPYSMANEGPSDIQDFQKTPKRTVLILNSSDVSAAGSNLTNANHVIFFTPLLLENKYQYDSQMAQAVGRIDRHGQNREMHVYRMVALGTIDVDILEQRERRTDMLVEVSASRETFNSKPVRAPSKAERVQLVRDPGDGTLKLVPTSILLDGDGPGVQGKTKVHGYEEFSSLVKFSKSFPDGDND